MSHGNGEHAYRHMVKGPEAHAHHVSLYWIVFGMLIVLTFLTVYLARFDFGSMSILVTLAIAGAKASLVFGVFMHLYFDNKFYALVVSTSLVFLSLFILFPILDMGSRDLVDPVRGNFGPRDEKVFQYTKTHPGALPLRPGLQDPAGKKLIMDDEAGESAHH